MKQALLTMLEMQHRMNTRVHPQWIDQDFEWYRAVWLECGELLDHYGYKWWKKQEPDMAQVQLEVIDIWHFGMSALFTPEGAIEDVAETILGQLEKHVPTGADVRESTEALALHSLETRSFDAGRFWDLMSAAGIDFPHLVRAYVGKNVLNFFRQDHGYQDGSYMKLWHGREDNEHLAELVETLDAGAADYEQQLYGALAERYGEVRDERSA
jgi:hypothetical protein